MQLSPVDAAGPDQTRVAKRSIGHDDRQLVQPIIHDMVIAHLAYSIRAALTAQRDRDDHVVWIETSMRNRGVLRCSKWVEHVFVWIDPCGNSRKQRNADSRRQHDLRYPARAV